ncbi:MAG: nicotinamide riboside transporter PnuC [Niabella sp.]
MQYIWNQFLQGMANTTLLEYLAVFLGIASVWYSKKENIWVFPTGIANTVVYIYLSFKNHLPGEASVNLYYTIMNIYGWWIWTQKDANNKKVVHIQFSNNRWWIRQILFFVICYFIIFLALVYLKKNFFPGAIPWADALASSTAFTGMWLMTKKKVESWYWWIITNICSIPLYFVKGLVFTSVYYIVLLILAIGGLTEWMQRAKQTQKSIG